MRPHIAQHNRPTSPQQQTPHSPSLWIYTLGYTQPGAWELVEAFTQQMGVLLVDVRWQAHSQWPRWSGPVLAAGLGAHYVHLPALGNVYCRTRTTPTPASPILLADPTTGMQQVLDILEVRRQASADNGDLLLLCECADWQRCHRREVATLLRSVLPGARVAHIGQVCTRQHSQRGATKEVYS